MVDASQRMPCLAQETYYELLLAGQFISEEEREVLRWGRNAKVTIPARLQGERQAWRDLQARHGHGVPGEACFLCHGLSRLQRCAARYQA